MVKRNKAGAPPEKLLPGRLKRAAAEYPALRANREGEVVRWQWTSGPCFDPRPYEAEISESSRGEPLTAEPAEKYGNLQYGFDAASRVVVERDYGNLPGHYDEQFFVYTDHGVEAVRYRASPIPKEAINVSHYLIESGNVVKYQALAPRGRTIQTYEYHDGRVARIRVEYPKWRSDPAWGRDFELVHDDHGELAEIIELFPDGQRSFKFRRPTRALDDLLPAIRAALLDQIPHAVAKTTVAEPVYCLGLAYTTDSHYCLPPRLVVGLERERAASVQRAHGQTPAGIWNLDMLHTFEDIQLVDPQLSELCDMANTHFQIQGTIAPGEELLKDVARALNDLPWEDKLRVTDDFIVYAADVEKGGTSEEIAACVPSARFSVLRSRSLL